MESVQKLDLRTIVRRLCYDCNHAWQQPAETGKCPRCHGSNVKNIEITRTEAKRV